MPIHPEIAAKKGIQVPLLIGYVNREGIIFEKSMFINLKFFC